MSGRDRSDDERQLYEDLGWEETPEDSPGLSPGKVTRTMTAYGGKSNSRIPTERLGMVMRRLRQGARATGEPGGAVERAAGSSGSRLPDGLRSDLEGALGSDLSGVQVHTDAAAGAAAQSLGADAYAVDQGIYFAPGTYDPTSERGRELIAHETAHTVQQSAGSPGAQTKLQVSEPGDALEQEADAFASAFVQGAARPVVGRASGEVQRQEAASPSSAPAAGEERQALPFEPQILALLNRAVAPDDAPGIQDRKRQLMSLFRAVSSEHRSQLRERLAKKEKGDELAKAFEYRLATPTRQSLLRLLEGEAVPLPGARDSVLFSAFQSARNPVTVRTEPPMVALDSAWRKSQQVRLFPTAEFGPPAEADPVQVVWRVHRRSADGEEEVVAEQSTVWLPAMPSGESIELEVDKAGTYNVELELSAAGLVGAVERSSFDVLSTDDESLAARVGASDIAAGVHEMSDVQLIEQARAIREQLANTQPEPNAMLGATAELPADYQLLRRALHAVEFVASQRGLMDELSPQRDEPAKMTSIPGLGFELAAEDPGVLRRQLENLIAEYGQEGAEDKLAPLLTYDVSAGTSDESSRIFAAKEAVLRQLSFLRAENEAFMQPVESMAKQIGFGLLTESRIHVQAAMAQYGIETEEEVKPPGAKWGTPTVEKKPKVGDNANTGELEDMVATAKQLIAKHREFHQLNVVFGMANNKQARINAQKTVGGAYQRRFEQIAREYAQMKREALQKHPALEGYIGGQGEPTKDMSKLAGKKPTDAGMMLGGDLIGHLENIEEAREGLENGDLPVWENPKIMELVKARLGVVDGTMRAGLIDAKIREETSGSWTDALFVVVTLGAALVATLLPGGQAVAAELALLAVDLAIMADDIDQYQLEQAAANTDFSEARQLAASEPSLFPVVTSMVAVGIGLHGVRSVVKQAKQLRAVARASDDLADPELARLRAELNRIGAPHGKPDLGDEIVDSARRSSDEISTLRRLGDEAAPGMRPAAEGSQELLQRRLGTALEPDESLGTGVQIDFDVDAASGHVTVRKVRYGPAARTADVLAHRRTIQLLTRYNGAWGRLRKLLDRILELFRGTGAKPGSEAWKARLEVEKLQRLVAWRRQSMLADPGRVDELVEQEIAFLQRQVDRFSDIAESGGRGATPGPHSVGMPDTSEIGDAVARIEDATFDIAEREGRVFEVPGEAPRFGDRVTGGSSTKLRENMNEEMARGAPDDEMIVVNGREVPARELKRGQRWPGYRAHHIIPSELKVHPVVRKAGLQLDHASNGIALPYPKDRARALSIHRGFHKAYNDAMRRCLNEIDVSLPVETLRVQVQRLQAKARRLLEQGNLLHQSDKLKVDPLADLWYRQLSK